MKEETFKKAAKSYICSNKFESPEGHGMTEVKEAFIEGAKSDAARDYWFKVFKEQFKKK